VEFSARATFTVKCSVPEARLDVVFANASQPAECDDLRLIATGMCPHNFNHGLHGIAWLIRYLATDEALLLHELQSQMTPWCESALEVAHREAMDAADQCELRLDAITPTVGLVNSSWAKMLRRNAINPGIRLRDGRPSEASIGRGGQRMLPILLLLPRSRSGHARASGAAS